jgi:glutathione S-transferase
MIFSRAQAKPHTARPETKPYRIPGRVTRVNYRNKDESSDPMPIILYTSKDPVHGGLCPYSQSTIMTLLEKRLAFKEEKVDLSTRDGDFLELYHSIIPDLSVRERVPVMVNGHTRLCDSLIINEYLARRFAGSGTPLIPVDNPAGEAAMKLFIDYFMEHVVPAYSRLIKVEDVNAQKEAKAQLVTSLEAVDAFLQLHSPAALGELWALGPRFGWSMHQEMPPELQQAEELAHAHAYFLGDVYSLAETSCTPFVERLMNVLPEWRQVDVMAICAERKLLRLALWMRACVLRPTAIETSPGSQELINGLVSREWSVQ